MKDICNPAKDSHQDLSLKIFSFIFKWHIWILMSGLFWALIVSIFSHNHLWQKNSIWTSHFDVAIFTSYTYSELLQFINQIDLCVINIIIIFIILTIIIVITTGQYWSIVDPCDEITRRLNKAINWLNQRRPPECLNNDDFYSDQIWALNFISCFIKEV